MKTNRNWMKAIDVDKETKGDTKISDTTYALGITIIILTVVLGFVA